MNVRSCARCLAPVVWAYTSTGEALMLDLEPHPEGDIEIVSTIGNPLAVVHAQPDLLGAERHRLHRTTCTKPPPGLPGAPQAPHVAGSDTSREAADALDGTTTEKDRRAILDYLERHGPATDEQIADALGMNPNSQRPRRLELKDQGLIYEYGRAVTASGRKAKTWRIKIQEQLA